MAGQQDYVITVVTNPQREALSQAFMDSMALSLPAQGIPAGRSDWLAAGVACDMHVSHGDGAALMQAVARIVQDQPYDAIVQPAANRRKKLLISDMDSTMIDIECIDELADFVGKKTEVALITELAMNGQLDFAQALTRRVALLAGLPETVLQECYDERVTFMQGAKALVATMRAQGAHTVLVSGGFTFFTSRVREALGFHEDHANRLEVQNGVLTGRVLPPVLGKEAKLHTLRQTCNALSISLADALAIGDGANDLPMLLAAGHAGGLGVAYHARPVVNAQVDARIIHGDLSALLYAQGYRQREIVS